MHDDLGFGERSVFGSIYGITIYVLMYLWLSWEEI